MTMRISTADPMCFADVHWASLHLFSGVTPPSLLLPSLPPARRLIARYLFHFFVNIASMNSTTLYDQACVCILVSLCYDLAFTSIC